MFIVFRRMISQLAWLILVVWSWFVVKFTWVLSTKWMKDVLRWCLLWSMTPRLTRYLRKFKARLSFVFFLRVIQRWEYVFFCGLYLFTKDWRKWAASIEVVACSFHRECESVSKVVSIDKSRFDRRQESVQSVSIELIYQICLEIFCLEVQRAKEWRIIYICIESQYLLSLALISKPLLRSNWPLVRMNSLTKQPSIRNNMSLIACHKEIKIDRVLETIETDIIIEIFLVVFLSE